jgi:hypothetical protein
MRKRRRKKKTKKSFKYVFLLKMRVYQSTDTSKWPKLPVSKDRQRENVQKSPQSPGKVDLVDVMKT